MALSEAMREALECLDLPRLRRITAEETPHLPQLISDEETLTAAHLARTAGETVRFRSRAYSHRWLTERGLPSLLPDKLKPSAEQLCPRVVQAVGHGYTFKSDILKPAGKLIDRAVSEVIEDAFVNGDTDPVLVSKLMREAAQKEKRKLLGRLAS